MNQTFVNQVHTFFRWTLNYGSRFSLVHKFPVNHGSQITPAQKSLSLRKIFQYIFLYFRKLHENEFYTEKKHEKNLRVIHINFLSFFSFTRLKFPQHKSKNSNIYRQEIEAMCQQVQTGPTPWALPNFKLFFSQERFFFKFLLHIRKKMW